MSAPWWGITTTTMKYKSDPPGRRRSLLLRHIGQLSSADIARHSVEGRLEHDGTWMCQQLATVSGGILARSLNDIANESLPSEGVTIEAAGMELSKHVVACDAACD